MRNYPYGETRWQLGTDVSDFGFTDQRKESFGLMDYNARYYDSYLNRFVSPDTIVPDYSNPQSLNRYSYALNNPVKYNDPSGHCVWDACIVEGAIIGAGVALAIDYGVQVKQNMDAGMSFWDAAYHQNVDTQSLGTSMLFGVAGGALGTGAIPVAASATGTVAASTVTALGVTEGTAATVGTVSTFATDMALAGTTNAVMGSAQRTVDRAITGQQVIWQDFADDFHQNYQTDFAYGAASSVIGQTFNAGIDANFPEVSHRTQPNPIVIKNLRFGIFEQRPPVFPPHYNPATPAIRGGLQTGALILSDANVLPLIKKHLE